jgi:hypothetical protein
MAVLPYDTTAALPSFDRRRHAINVSTTRSVLGWHLSEAFLIAYSCATI